MAITYTGVSVIAQMYWCHKKAIIQAELGELLFQSTAEYILQRAKMKPKEWLTLPNGTLMLKPRIIKRFVWEGPETLDLMAMYEAAIAIEIPAEKKGKIKQNPLFRGGIDEYKHARFHTRTMGLFRTPALTVVAVPDALEEDFAYEFKSSNLVRFMRPVARTQANLYAYIFQKSRWVVDIYVPRQDKTYTYEQEVDIKSAKDDLEKFTNLIFERMEPWPCKEWKCKSCEHMVHCERRWK